MGKSMEILRRGAAFGLFIVAASVANAEKEISRPEQLDPFIQGYYLDPKPGLIESAIRIVGATNMAADENARIPLLMSFSCLFAEGDSELKSTWQAAINRQPEPERALLMRSLTSSPEEILDNIPVSAGKNDANWSCFFVTGNSKYLDGIIETLQHLDERKDLNLFMTAASAKWSLSANARHHKAVNDHVAALKKNGSDRMREIAADILRTNPQAVREETVAILKAQREKGLW